MQEIKRLEEMFAVDTAKLKSITEHFVKELAKGETVSYLESYLLTFIRVEC